MALIKCPECRNDVSNIANACPRCGRPLNPYGTPFVAPSEPSGKPAEVTPGRVLGALVVIAISFGYLIPWGIAYARQHNQDMVILVINLLLGWTIIGWIGTLVWSLSPDVKHAAAA